MSDNKLSDLQSYLSKFTETDWLAAVDELLPCIHEVDRNALQIWFRFYPLSLHRVVAEAEDREEVLRGFALQGDFELNDQIDTSLRNNSCPSILKNLHKATALGSTNRQSPKLETLIK